MNSTISPLPSVIIAPLIQRALAEDFGDAGDLTSQACIPADTQMNAIIAARKPGHLAGLHIAAETFRAVDPTIEVTLTKEDGNTVKRGDKALTLSGPAQSVLMAERVALNFLGHMSGIATITAALVAQTKGTETKIACTRKTTPGLRALEKYAVRCGGGYNHRFGLYDGVMIKDNHIAAAGSIKKALHAVKSAVGHTVKVEIEVDTLSQLEEVLKEGVDIILLDNMNTDELKNAVAMTKGRAILEASGNVTVDTVKAIARTGIDYISSGWITHSAPVLDLGLDVV